MDPTTTLITFMLHTSPSVQSVKLVGSWDNFAKRYPMEKDARKGRGEWRGVHSFKDITCDGDGARSLKRNGGLKMGHTYWYYYELNDGTEIHNPTLPSTTSCPYLPGQPVNLLDVPVEVSPLRERSASEGAMTDPVKTMNPADKFMTPRPPPAIPRPQLSRINTSHAITNRKRSARSASPRGGRSPWSPRALFGLLSPSSALPERRDRDRLVSPVPRYDRDASIKKPTLPSPTESKLSKSITGTTSSRDTSPHSIRKTFSRDPSPLRQPVSAENSLNPMALIIPDEIAEEEFEDDDDDNFANPVDPEKAAVTSLSPPPTRQLDRLCTAMSDMKPLPMLPDEFSPLPVADSPSMVPAPLHVTHPSACGPRSHFSIDTISTGFVSPTESHFSSPPSIYDSNDDEDGDPVTDDSYTFHSAGNGASLATGFANVFQYLLPDGDFGSESTLKNSDVAATGLNMEGLRAKVTVRTTFGPQAKGEDAVSVLDQLLVEMGYLGDIIAGK